MTQRIPCFLLGIFWLAARLAQGQTPPAAPAAPEYLPNHGQWPAAVHLRTDVAPGLRLFAEAGRLVWLRYDAAAWAAGAHAASHARRPAPGGAPAPQVAAHAWAVEFVGAAPGVVPQPEGEPVGPVRNYLLGRDARQWATGIRGTAAARYPGLWPGIDLRLHTSPAGNFEYDLDVKPGADPTRVALRYCGLTDIRLDARTGHMQLRTALGELTEAAPVAWQPDGHGGRRAVPVRFALKTEKARSAGGAATALLSFVFPAGFDRAQPLTVDPVLVFATHSGSTSPVFGHTATYDRFGHLYAAGPCYDPGYPTTLGAFDLAHSNGTVQSNYNNPDVAITRYAPDGRTLRYATYLGGTADDYPHSLLVNHGGDLLILGTTHSADFPTTPAAFDTSYNQQYDVFVARLDSTGSRLLGSTYLGGRTDDGYTQNGLPYFYGDDYRGDLEVDSLDRVYVATTTTSADFPFSTGAVRPPAGFLETAAVVRFSADLSRLDWAAGLGTRASAYSLYVPPSGAPYVVGTTFSTGFPTTTGTLAPDSTRGTSNRQRDGFIAQLSPTADSIRTSTYLRPTTAGQPTSQTFFVQGIPGSTDMVVLGSSTGTYALSAGRWGQAGGGLVLQRLSASLRQRRWTTTIGHPLTTENPGFPVTDNLSPTAFLVDRCGAIYVSAWGNTTGLTTTTNALQRTTDGQDLYMLVLTPDAVALEYATFLGGHSANNFAEEHVDGGTSRFDPQGRVYQAICTNSADFPTTAGSWSPQTQVVFDQYDEVSVKLDFERRLVQAIATAVGAGGGPTNHLTIPATVQFVNRSTTFAGTTYQWTFGDGSPPSAAFAPQHIYTRTGTFGVTLVARDAGSCAGADTTRFQLTLHRPDTTASRAFSICRGDSVQLTGVLLQPGSFNWSPAASLSNDTIAAPWATPDSTTTYAAFGTLPGSTQRIRWAVTVTVRERLLVAAAATAVGGGPASGQPAPATVLLLNNTPTLPATRWRWTFGDGSAPDTVRAPQHVFTRTGTYAVWLVGRSANACNAVDSVQLTITVVLPDTATSQTLTICSGDSVQLPGQALAPGTFRWSPDATLSDATARAPWAAPFQTTTYEATGRAAAQDRQLTVRVTVTVRESAPIVWNADQRCLPGGTTATFRLAGQLPATGTWDFGDGTTAPLAGASIDHTYILPAGEQEFNVAFSGRDGAGCRVQARQLFRAETFQVPNVITPGTADGLNDALQLPCFEAGTATLRVFNRWGRLVYDSGAQRYANDWRADGLAAGTYFYQLRLAYAPAPYQGWVEVVR